MMYEGFYKVDERGSTYIVATLYNPETGEEKTICVRDYDYSDCSRDNDEVYNMPIDEAARRQWLRKRGVIQRGDTVKVVKGRKVKIGTVATVTDIRPYRNCYGQTVALYVYLDNGQRTNIDNCEIA